MSQFTQREFKVISPKAHITFNLENGKPKSGELIVEKQRGFKVEKRIKVLCEPEELIATFVEVQHGFGDDLTTAFMASLWEIKAEKEGIQVTDQQKIYGWLDGFAHGEYAHRVSLAQQRIRDLGESIRE